MTKYLLLFTFLMYGKLNAQEILKTTTHKGSAQNTEGKGDYKRAIVSTQKEGLYAFEERWKDGSLKRRGFALEYEPKFKQIGKETTYHPNGEVKQIQYIKDHHSVGKIQMFYANGKLKEEGEFQKPTGSVGITRFDEPNYIVKQIADSLGNNFLDSAGSGKVNITYANGDIVEGEYIKGLKHGERKEYYSKFNETYIEEYEQGKFLKGNYINSAGVKTEYKGKEQFPEFKGGMKEFYKFISQNLRYPKLMKENNIQGRVTVGFVVEKDGALSDIKVIKGVPNGSQLDDEAIRVISLSPKWNPGIQRGKPVRVSYSFPLVFSLTNEPAKKL